MSLHVIHHRMVSSLRDHKSTNNRFDLRLIQPCKETFMQHVELSFLQLLQLVLAIFEMMLTRELA